MNSRMKNQFRLMHRNASIVEAVSKSVSKKRLLFGKPDRPLPKPEKIEFNQRLVNHFLYLRPILKNNEVEF
jgi:hypothetical protein